MQATCVLRLWAAPVAPEAATGPVTLSAVEYCAGHEYRNGVLERVHNDYGYWAGGRYHYYIKDYQGNVRAVIDEAGRLEEVNNYYPYGGLMGAAGSGVQPRKYGGKELDRENGLDWYDSQARHYDPTTGRTPTMDSKAESYYSLNWPNTHYGLQGRKLLQPEPLPVVCW